MTLKIAPLAALIAAFIGSSPTFAATTPVDTIVEKFRDPALGVFIVAHRGCHSPAPGLFEDLAPENSILSLERCIRLGIDMVELDVRKSKDGHLVVIHDTTLDRTTNAQGKVSDYDLKDLQNIYLKQDFGGQSTLDLTQEKIPSLSDYLDYANGKIMLNLDIKDDVYQEVAELVLKKNMASQVVIKKAPQSPSDPLSGKLPYRQLPFMPILGRGQKNLRSEDLLSLAEAEVKSFPKPVGIELSFLDRKDLPAIRALAQKAHIRLWYNTLSRVGVTGIIGMGGDAEALTDKGATWDQILNLGIDTIQTDEPARLLAHLKARKIKP